MAAPCEGCGRETTLLYGHWEEGEHLHLCQECHPERTKTTQ